MWVEVTPRIRNFLQQAEPAKTPQAPDAKQLKQHQAVDFDVLTRMVSLHNKAVGPGEAVRLHQLMEGSAVLGREPARSSLGSLSELEQLRAQAQERKYQRSVSALLPSRKRGGGPAGAGAAGQPTGDVFNDYRKSLAIGVNALVGLFLTFAGGFWAAEYAGVQTLSTRLLVGLVMSFVCLLVEVFLLILHDERQRGRRAAASTPPATVPRSFSIPEECAAPSSPAPAPEPFAAPAARGELQPAKETGVELQLAKKTEVELQLRKRSKVQAATIELTAIKEPPAFVGDKANEPTGPKSASRDDAMGGQSHIASSIGKRISEGGVAPSSLSDRHDTMRQRK
eukprot:GHVT01033349.1.p1 GENE.GHVT01033349.1~~GHVT01033349.1.p1  ORF type:complete len:339 (+),score=77.32 GHVT01033349.1:1720-2736(+)